MKHEKQALTIKEKGGLDKHMDLYRDATRQFARASESPWGDIDHALLREIAQCGLESCIRPDGVHLTTYGNACVARAVYNVLVKKIQHPTTKSTGLNPAA